MSEKKWYVIYTRPRWEKKVASLLEDRQIEFYCPMHTVRRQWSDRKKLVTEPLFKGYVFVHVESARKWDITQVPGVINYVYWLGKPAVVQEKEINTIRKFLKEFNDISVEKVPEINDEVLITRGVMMQYKGIVLEIIGKKAKVFINSLGLVITASFNLNDMEVISHLTE
ncbi:MAG TPA: UpxY family transcription antiterminator [Ferruginibacter sp.]|nr:UpxY family transcription antiterminator [Ferruginibacter sp.]HRO05223.1 UpxY family transcription antiterminator [Ferruginibacter sp.]HRO95985.1 UpxY family transcription antiterminator [Ferruginibacter sp.]HRP48680.1 UpxY family transcription antiterminator [Ferruginibacter sp.]